MFSSKNLTETNPFLLPELDEKFFMTGQEEAKRITCKNKKIQKSPRDKTPLDIYFSAVENENNIAEDTLNDSKAIQQLSVYPRHIANIMRHISDEKSAKKYIEAYHSLLSQEDLTTLAIHQKSAAIAILNHPRIQLSTANLARIANIYPEFLSHAKIYPLLNTFDIKQSAKIFSQNLSAALELANDLMNGWLHNIELGNKLVNIFSYFVHHKAIANFIINHPLLIERKKSATNVVDRIILAIGLFHPELILTSLADLDPEYADSLAFHPIIAEKLLETETTSTLTLAHIAELHPSLGLKILRKPKFIQEIAAKKLIGIGKSHVDLTDMIIETAGLRAKLSDDELYNMTENFYKSRSKLYIYQITTTPSKNINWRTARDLLDNDAENISGKMLAQICQYPDLCFWVYDDPDLLDRITEECNSNEIAAIAAKNITIAHHYLNLADDSFTADNIHYILTSFPQLLARLLEKLTHPWLVKITPMTIMKCCIAEPNIAHSILFIQQHEKLLEKLSTENILSICQTIPHLLAANLSALKAHYSKKITQLAHQIEKIIPKAPASTNTSPITQNTNIPVTIPQISPYQILAQNIQSATFDFKTEIALSLPLWMPSTHHKVQVANFNTPGFLFPNDAARKGNCAGICLDFIRFVVTFQNNLMKSYIEKIQYLQNDAKEIKQYPMYFIDRIYYFQEYILEKIVNQKILFYKKIETVDLTEHNINQLILSIFELLKTHTSLLIGTGEHALALTTHPVDKTILFIDSNKILHCFRILDQDALGVIREQLCQANSTPIIELTVYPCSPEQIKTPNIFKKAKPVSYQTAPAKPAVYESYLMRQLNSAVTHELMAYSWHEKGIGADMSLANLAIAITIREELVKHPEFDINMLRLVNNYFHRAAHHIENDNIAKAIPDLRKLESYRNLLNQEQLTLCNQWLYTFLAPELLISGHLQKAKELFDEGINFFQHDPKQMRMCKTKRDRCAKLIAAREARENNPLIPACHHSWFKPVTKAHRVRFDEKEVLSPPRKTIIDKENKLNAATRKLVFK